MLPSEYKICRAVLKYHTLGAVLSHTGYKSYDDLSDQFNYYALDYDGYEPDSQTVLTLTRAAKENYHSYRSSRMVSLRSWIAIFIAFGSLVVAVIALFL